MPVQGPIHVDRPLTNISIAFKSEGLIADELFPQVPVVHETDSYFVFDRANSMRTPRAERANGADAAEDNIVMTTATYRVAEFALKDIITDRDRNNQDPGLNLEVSTVEDLTDKILRVKEVDAATLVFTNGNWANESSLAAAGAWSANTTVSNPILNMDSGASTVLTNSGRPANVGVLDYRTFLAAKEHTSIVERIRFVSSDSVTPKLLQGLFNLEMLLIAKGQQNTAVEGVAATMANIWTDSAWIGYVEQSPGLRRPSALYCFKQSGGGTEVRRWRDDPRKGEWFEVSQKYAQDSPASECGYLIVDTVQ